MSGFFLHLHPPRVTRRALCPLTTLGVGVAAFVLFLILGVTGLLLMLYYVPTLDGALASTQDIEYAVAYGDAVRAIHRYGAHAMVFCALCHLLRVFFTAAYRGRARNFGIGLALLACTLGLAFTGYLLPGDQLSYWAVVVSTNLLDHLPGVGPPLKRLLLGGAEIGDATIVRFYALHVALLPAVTLGLAFWHLWRVRKDGGLALEPCPRVEAETLPAHPHLTLREGAMALLITAGLLLVAAYAPAPLGPAPDLHQPSNPEKTPWYFLWLQEMVSYSAPVGGFVFPLLVLTGLLLLPFVDREGTGTGAWFGAGPERRACLATAVLSAVLFVALQWGFSRPGVSAQLAAAPAWVRHLLNPAVGMLAAAILAGVVARFAAGTRRAAALACGAALVIGMVGFTIVGWCRGPGWIFFWPWEAWPHV